VTDREYVALAGDRHAFDLPRENDLPRVVGQLARSVVVHGKLGVVGQEQPAVFGEQRAKGGRDRVDRGVRGDRPRDALPLDEQRRARTAIEVDAGRRGRGRT
jgi:hypothetical protein